MHNVPGVHNNIVHLLENKVKYKISRTICSEKIMLISIIIPVYNVEKYLRQCLESIQQQTYPDWEAILVDDGSSDGSSAICDEYAKKDGRFRVVHQANAGVSSARNVGLNNAHGKWITFLDADDRLKNNALEYYADHVNENIDMVMAGYVSLDDESNVIFEPQTHEDFLLDKEQALTMMYKPMWFPYQGYLWNKCYRKSLIDAHHLRFDERIFFNEDRLFVTQYLCSILKEVLYTSSVVYEYCKHNGSAMSSLKKGYNVKFFTDLKGYEGMRKAIRSILPSPSLLKLADQGILDSYRQIERILVSGGYPRQKAQIRLMWMYFKILGPIRLAKDIILPHFERLRGKM